MATIPYYYSTLTQKLLNYFPHTDSRVRENPMTISAQLLNAVAIQAEEQQTQVNRELRALNLSDMPMNIDNSGVYYATPIPTTYTLPSDGQGNLLPPTTIKGQIANGPLVTLVPYNDLLPVPTRITLDPILSPVAMANPQILNVVGNGGPLIFTPGQLTLPNNLTFQIYGMGPVTESIVISIVGELDPPAVWPQDVQSKNEILTISDDGFYQTSSVWNSINVINVSGLPLSCQLICWNLPVVLPAEPDPDRPFTHFAYRGIDFPRYWKLLDSRLLEVYQRNRFAGYEIFNTSSLPRPMVDVAVEPNTSGIFLTDGVSLLYGDRRTAMPTNLVETGLTVEPAYAISVCYDASQVGDTTYVNVSPIAGPLASTVNQYRYVVQDPVGNVFVVQPNGVFATYTGYAGWTQGKPGAINFALIRVGTYLISLETLGYFNAKTVDTFAYNNSGFVPLVVISMASLVPSIQGIAFDAYDHLWIWTGSYAVPVVPHYDAYLWDASTRTVYATDQYTQLQIS